MQEISFSPAIKKIAGLFDPPVPASSLIPSWYREMQTYIGDRPVYGDMGTANMTIKRCMPVFDALTAGYYITAPADIYFENGQSAVWSALDFKLIMSHSGDQFSKLPHDREKFEENALKWQSPWHIKTPKGYSCLFTHPMYQDDVPFLTLSGIVDTDTHPTSINFPFLMAKGFTGIVEMGTPIVQLIPFKRDDWKISIDPFNEKDEHEWKKAYRIFQGRYRKWYRSPKSYA